MDAKFNYNLVLLGRQLRQISQEELAEKSFITQGHLSKIETGLTEPSEEVIKNIATALDLPVAFFQQSDRVYGLPVSLHPMYRKQASVGQHALEYIHAEVNIRFMHLRKLIKSVNLKNAFPLPQFDPDEYHGDIEKIAELVRRTWLLQKGPLQNLTECIEQSGCLVIWCHFPNIPIYGISYKVPDLPPCIFLNKNQSADRMRFTLAHELGHLIMHRVPTSDMEKQANQFASALLMPSSDIKGSLLGRITIPRIAALKPLWRVSIQALVERAASMGSITPMQQRYLWQQISASKMRLREPPELDFPYEEPKILPMIFEIHLKELGYTTKDISNTLNFKQYELTKLYPFIDKNGTTNIRLVST
jgi:Zn-dependent peptidase ImmA (M78 family)/DNA-binding XRE family transcriptional regulator